MKNIFQQKVSETIWKETYKWETDKTIEDTFKRVAKTLASVEEDRKKWEKEFYNLINNFKFVLGGRIFSNAGTKLKGTCMVNCFVSGFNGKDQDSMEGIFTELYRQAKILKSEGGYGCNFDVLRPDGNFVKGIGVESCGAVQWMSAWNGISKIVTKGSSSRKQKEIQVGKNKIRKGAMMGNMSVWHPDIFNFIKVKQEKGKLELFNLSVLLTDKFMSAVKNKKNWDLIFPDTTYSKYDSEWDGNIEKWISKKYPIKVWDTVKAVDLWDLIIECNYNKGEPGVLFIDRINDLNNLYYCEEIYGTNPCGEEPLPINGACVLGSINLTQYIREDKTDLDYNKLEKDIPTMVRMLDNVIDVTNYPLLEQKKEELSKRRIGIGYLGYASTLHILGIAYGSSKALKITKELVQYVTNNLYRASALLADVKGIFPLYREKEYLKSLFIQKTLSTETTNLIKKHGIRNSHLTTIAPTGTISILANNVSSGIEPVIHTSYMRTFMESNPPEDLILPTEIDWIHQQYKSENGWKWELEGDQYILKKKFKNVIYKLYEDRGLCREEEVYDYGYINMKDKFNADKEKAEKDKKDFYGKTIFDLTVDDHIKTLAYFAPYIDSAIAKTVNVPNDYPYDDFKNIYMKAYNSGSIKGLTTYREGTRTNVITVKVNEKNGIKEREAPQRPEALPCHVYRVTVKGEEWAVFVGLFKGHPYEVFSGKMDLVYIPSKIKEGMIVKHNGRYSFEHEGEPFIKDINKIFANIENEAKTRLISMNLRYGAPIFKIVEQLDKVKGDEGNITDFIKAVTRALKKYIPDGVELENKCPDCGSSLLFIEGCYQCQNKCGFSRC